MNILSIVIKMKLWSLTNKENNYEISCTSPYHQPDYSSCGYHTLFNSICYINHVFCKKLNESDDKYKERLNNIFVNPKNGSMMFFLKILSEFLII